MLSNRLAPGRQKGAALAGELLLIIDDNADVCTLLGERVLPSYGYRTLTARDGASGLWQIRTRRPDLILLDLRLPDMTGLDLLHLLTSEGYDIPVILVTAYGSEMIAAQALRLGVRDYIIKPFTLDEIVESIERALAEQRLRNERNLLTDDLRFCTDALRLLSAAGAEFTASAAGPSRLCTLLDLAVEATRARAGRLWVQPPTRDGLVLWVLRAEGEAHAYLVRRAETVPVPVARAWISGIPEQWSQSSDPPEMGLAIPLMSGGQPVGVLEVHLGESTATRAELVLLVLGALAGWLGLALEPLLDS
ncbi:MAG: response regulator [Chloroflexia bacterium]